MNPRTAVVRTRYWVRTSISHIPALYLPLMRAKQRDPDGATIVGPHTDLVIEAFPRSGNTFAVAALRQVEPRRYDIAHHCHAPAQLIQAARLGKPIVLIVRRPRDSVLSFMIRHPEVAVRQALRSWIHFHEKVLPLTGRFVIASFEQVTADFGSVLDRVNGRFGTDFPRFEHTSDNVDACFAAIERRNALRFGDGVVQQTSVARPSAERHRRKLEIERHWAGLEGSRLERRAVHVYERLMREAER
ncbi:MAG: hypothetical protein ACPGJF_07200 [Sinimarinibacterium flocculans]|uniref:hypothetical protein n=1 Tax=Sinimarinibacterium flocculans TaxID=985250 RepID=UPI003C4CB8D2